MNRNEYVNPAFKVARESEGLRIGVPVKPERFRTLLNLVWLLVWAAGEAAIILFLLGTPSGSRPLAGLILTTFTLAGGIVLWRWLWIMGGRETFLVTPTALLARREIWGIGHTRKLDLEKIRSVRAEWLRYRVIYPSWGRMFVGHEESQIVIQSAGRAYPYGRGLEEAEARGLVDLLQEEMEFHRPQFPGARSAQMARAGLNA